MDIVTWLLEQNVEVAVPPLFGFFTQYFANTKFDRKAYLKNSGNDRITDALLEIYVNHFVARVEGVMKSFHLYRQSHDLNKLASETSRTVSLANQAGEGWLLTAEMIAMLHSGINDIVCMQPFGCLANHITGKGISQKLKTLYPGVNLLFLDMDPGHSEVNIQNRLHFIVTAAKDAPRSLDHVRFYG